MAELADYTALTDGDVRLVRLTRLTWPEPTEVYVGPARFEVVPLPANRRIGRAAGHVGLTVTTEGDEWPWAEFDTSADFSNGALVSEDYQCELADVDTDDGGQTDGTDRRASLADALADAFVGMADRIAVGGVSIDVPEPPAATLAGFGDTVTTGDRVRVFWGARDAPRSLVMVEGVLGHVSVDDNHAVVDHTSFALQGAGFRRRFERLEPTGEQ